jgi:excisionase family DNA binding protein
LPAPRAHATTTVPGRTRYVRQIEIKPKWLTTAEVAVMLGYGLTKTKMLVITGELRSVKDGGSRRIMPQWVDDYIARRVADAEESAA